MILFDGGDTMGSESGAKAGAKLGAKKGNQFKDSNNDGIDDATVKTGSKGAGYESNVKKVMATKNVSRDVAESVVKSASQRGR